MLLLTLLLGLASSSVSFGDQNENGSFESTHVVDEHAPTLGEVSIYLYDSARFAEDIAEWNDMDVNDPIWIGKKLRIKRAPQLTPEKGRQAVLNFWRKKFHQPVIERSPERPQESVRPSPTPFPAPSPIPSPTPSPSPKSPEKLIQAAKKSIESGNLDKAQAQLSQARKTNPDSVEARLYELSVLKKNGNEKAWKKRAQELIKMKPEFKSLPMFKDLESSP